MKSMRFRVAALATVIGLAACGGGGGSAGVPPAPQPAPPPKGSPIDQIIAQNYPGGLGVELGIYRNGAPLYVRGYGLRDRGLPDSFGDSDFWRVPQPDQLYNLTRGAFAPDANTIYDLASVTKAFTAGAILLLQQDGKLSVNDLLSKYFPSFPNADQIPLIYLLQHRSGLVDYVNFGSYPDFTSSYQTFLASGNANYQAIVDQLATFPLQFTPGSVYQYSNSNYLLLGLIVAKISGEPLGSFWQQRIFGPLGMAQTHFGLPPPPVTDIALGYHNFGGGPQRVYQPNLLYAAGAGGLTSTVGDLEKWDAALRQPGIFTAASLTQMFTPNPFPQSYGTYSEGWVISALNGHRWIWHDGLIDGYSTMNAMFPDDRLDIVLLTNGGTSADPFLVVEAIFPIALTLTASARATAAARR